jgi:hypothetical protein
MTEQEKEPTLEPTPEPTPAPPLRPTLAPEDRVLLFSVSNKRMISVSLAEIAAFASTNP